MTDKMTIELARKIWEERTESSSNVIYYDWRMCKGFIEGYEAGVRKAIQSIDDMVPELRMDEHVQVKRQIQNLLPAEDL